jgi:hypothetical protein
MSTGPNIANPASMTPQMYDIEAVSVSGAPPGGDWTPAVGKKQNFARAFSINGAGNVKVDFLGVGGSGGAIGVVIPLPVGKFDIAVKKIYAAGTTATGVSVYY